MITISIPKPCHEDWNEMTANEQGRNCNVCCKTVFDFTSMSDEEVKYFFVNKKKEESVCGRFKNEQLQRINITLPYNIYKISMPLWKQFLTACLLAFSSMLFSCDALVGNDTKGDVMVQPTGITSMKSPALNIDTTAKPSCSTLMGDSVAVQTISITLGDTMVQLPIENIVLPEVLPPPVEEIDTPKTILTGKVMLDTNTIIHPKSVDSVKTKEDSSSCDNDFMKL